MTSMWEGKPNTSSQVLLFTKKLIHTYYIIHIYILYYKNIRKMGKFLSLSNIFEMCYGPFIVALTI